MAFLNVNTPLKNLKTGDYFYPLTNLDQIITGTSRLSAFMSEDSSNHNLLNLSNIGNLSVNGTSYFNGQVTATQFNGPLNGNAATATKLVYSPILNSDAAINSFHAANTFQAAVWTGTSFPGVSNGIILDMGYTSATYGAQIAIDDDPTYFIALRQRGGNGWKAWKRIPMGDGTGASGTWGISITGNAATATNADKLDGYHHDAFVKKSGDTMTGNLNFADNVGIYGIMGGGSDYWRLTGTGTNDAGVLQLTIGDNATNDYFDIIFSDWNGTDIKAIRFGGSSINAYVPLYGAVWNDYAEFRKSDTQEPGYVIAPAEDGIAYKTSVRMQAGARIISDTFGFAVGECDDAKTPVGLAGRVLAYTYQKRSNYKIGDAVCAAPNGTIDIMTREEIQKYPDRIIGIVNEIPDYEIWKSILTHPNGEQTIKEIEVKDRIWIDIK